MSTSRPQRSSSGTATPSKRRRNGVANPRCACSFLDELRPAVKLRLGRSHRFVHSRCTTRHLSSSSKPGRTWSNTGPIFRANAPCSSREPIILCSGRSSTPSELSLSLATAITGRCTDSASTTTACGPRHTEHRTSCRQRPRPASRWRTKQPRSETLTLELSGSPDVFPRYVGTVSSHREGRLYQYSRLWLRAMSLLDELSGRLTASASRTSPRPCHHRVAACSSPQGSRCCRKSFLVQESRFSD